MTEFIEVRTTIDTMEGAKKIAEEIVESRSAACVQISGPVTSIYWWKGQLETEKEWVCTAKTQYELYTKVERAIRKVHTYEEPEIIATAIVAGSSGYLEWINRETVKE